MQSYRPAAPNTFKSYRQKRRPSQPPPIHILPGQVVFRVVCHESLVGGVIGHNGDAIAQLRRETGTKIHCEAPTNGSEHWIVLIVGSSSIDKRIVLNVSVDSYVDNKEMESVECDASAAQAALIRVLERVWTVLAENDGDSVGDEEAYCGLLADTTQIGAVMGKGGKNIDWMRKETGAKIRILAPSCGSKGDELIQITGGTLAVKKALIVVSGCLQDCPPIDGYPALACKAVERFHNGNSKDPHLEFFPHLSSMLPPMTGNNATENASNGHLSSTDAEGDPNTDAKATEQEVVFRLLCSNIAAGGIIGKRGAIVRALQNETGASIVVGPPITASGERVVTISAFENLESWYSPAQNALVLVFARSVEIDIEKARLPGLRNGATVNTRLLVPSDFINCFNGNRSTLLSEMIEMTGVDIEILEGDQVSDISSGNEIVIQIVGEYKNVQNALFEVTGRLRGNLLPSEILNEVRARNPYGSMSEADNTVFHQHSNISSHFNQGSIQAQKTESVISGNTGAPLSPNLRPSQTAGRGHSLLVSNGEQGSKMLGEISELEKSLDYLLPLEVLDEVGARSTNGEFKGTASSGFLQSFIPSFNSDQETNLARGINQLGLSSNGGLPSLPNLCQSVKKSFRVRNISVEIVVAEDAFGAVYGKDGSSLNNLRQISGAKVEVQGPVEGEGLIRISGAPDITRAALSLLQSILSHQ